MFGIKTTAIPQLSWLLASISTLIIATGCGQQNKTNAEATSPDEILATDSITWCDSIVNGSNTLVCSITADYPIAGKQVLVDGIREWLAKILALDNPTNLNAPEAILAQAGKLKLDELADNVDAQFARPMHMECDINITKLCQTEGYVTYICNTYSYLGGAHGSTTVSGATFGTPEGVLYTYSMIKPVDIERVRQMVVNGIRTQYFGATPGEFADLLFESPDSIQLPETAPYLTPQGVTFVYQQYEIAPYAAGLPTCVIPYDSIASSLIPRVRDLIN